MYTLLSSPISILDSSLNVPYPTRVFKGTHGNSDVFGICLSLLSIQQWGYNAAQSVGVVQSVRNACEKAEV